MNAVFLDTVGLLALWDRSDQWHDAAEAAYQQLLQQGAELLTTTYVLLECGNAAARRPYRQAVVRLWEAIEGTGALIVPLDEDWRQAWRTYARGAPGEAGMVDHVSFSVMRRIGIDTAFTNDKHFRTAGFRTLF